MKRGLIAGVVALMFVCGIAAKSHAAEMKLGYIDMEKVFNEYEKTKTANAKLQDEQKKKRSDAEKMVTDINKLKEESELLSDDAKKGKEAMIKEKIKELRDYEKDTVNEIRDKLLSLRKEILDEITKIVDEKGKKEGYTYIFISDVMIFKDKAGDITEDVLKTLNAKSKK
ncbi:MAG TPA: OmpH family outer membrane protein [bacterium]|nr:OmpH family outer membrane protein [bacterium]